MTRPSGRRARPATATCKPWRSRGRAARCWWSARICRRAWPPAVASTEVVEFRGARRRAGATANESGAGAPPARRRGGHRAGRLGWSCPASPCPDGGPDDRGEDGPGRARGEGRRRRLPARRCRGGAAAADGGRRRGPDRRLAARALGRPAQLPQRLSRPGPGHPPRPPAAAHPQAAPGQLLPAVPRAPQDDREGLGGGHSGSLDRRGLDPARRRPGPGDGPLGHLEVAGLQAVQGHRRACQRLPRSAAGGRVALSLARRHLPQAARGRPHRLGGGDNRCRGQHRRPARDRRPQGRPVRGRDLLVRLPQDPGPARPQGRQAGRLRRPAGARSAPAPSATQRAAAAARGRG